MGTGFNVLVTRSNWGIYLFPEYSDLCFVLTFFGNILAHVLLVVLLATGLKSLLRKTTRSAQPAQAEDAANT